MLGNQWIRVMQPETESQMQENFIYDKGSRSLGNGLAKALTSAQSAIYVVGSILPYTQNVISAELQTEM